MKIKKIGHCCLLIETNDLRILTDPGAWSTEQNNLKDIDIVLITHEHADHFHLESLKCIIHNNLNVKIFTNKGVAKLLDQEKISYELLENGEIREYRGIKIEGYGEKHAEVYPSIEPVDNTGYFINDKFFYPGDAFINPMKEIDILALPVAGPWLKISEAVGYAKSLMPKRIFPVHDGMLKYYGAAHALPEAELKKLGIEFIALKDGEEHDFN